MNTATTFETKKSKAGTSYVRWVRDKDYSGPPQLEWMNGGTVFLRGEGLYAVDIKNIVEIMGVTIEGDLQPNVTILIGKDERLVVEVTDEGLLHIDQIRRFPGSIRAQDNGDGSWDIDLSNIAIVEDRNRSTSEGYPVRVRAPGMVVRARVRKGNPLAFDHAYLTSTAGPVFAELSQREAPATPPTEVPANVPNDDEDPNSPTF